jgi:hypothetical protein
MESSHALTPRTPDAYFDTGYCLGLLRGVANMNLLWQQYAKDPSMFFCPPSESTIHEWIPVVVTYLQDHPERLHEEDVLLASVALTRVFPCPPKAQRLRRRTK